MSKTIEEQALEQIPGYTDPGAEFERLAQLEKDLRRLTQTETWRAAQARLESLMEAGTDAGELVEARRAMYSAAADQTHARELLQDVTSRRTFLRTEAVKLGEDAVEPALAWLHSQLTALLGRVRTLHDALGGISTVEDALHGTDEQLQAWRELDAAARTYDEIRAAQTQITLKRAGFSAENDRDVFELLWLHGRTRNAFDTEPAYLAQRYVRPSSEMRNVSGAQRWVDWLDTGFVRYESPREAWSAGVTPAELRRLAVDGNAWVPTVEQLRTAGGATAVMLTPIRYTQDLRTALAAHDRYYRSRGINPVKPLDTDGYRAELPEPRRPGRRRVDDPPTGVDPRLAGLFG